MVDYAQEVKNVEAKIEALYDLLDKPEGDRTPKEKKLVENFDQELAKLEEQRKEWMARIPIPPVQDIVRITERRKSEDAPQSAMEVDRSLPELFFEEFSAEIKEDFSFVDKLSSNAFNVVVDRDGCLTGIANEILRRRLLSGCGLERRMIDRYIGFQAPPGGGKSQMIDHVSVLKGGIMNHVDVESVHKEVRSALGKHEEFTNDVRAMLNEQVAKLKTMLNESVYVPISFNGATPIKETASADQSISVRILYSYFIDKTKNLSFDSFVSRLMKVGEFDIEASLKMVNEHCNLDPRLPKKESMFLLFDEIGKVGSVEKLKSCLRCLAPFINGMRFSRCHVIISSLEVSNITISASRHIHFVHLNRLSSQSSMTLFHEFTQFEYVRRMIVTLGGSPRCLELLSRILVNNSHLLKHWNYQKLFDHLFSSVAKFEIPYSNLTIEDVRPALLRTKVEMGEVVHGRTYENSVERGMFLNSFNEEERESKLFVPDISPFALSIFASKMVKTKEEGSLLYQIGSTLYQLTGFLTREEQDLRVTPFEIAHGLWETLIRLLYQSKHPNENFTLRMTSIYPSFASKTVFDDLSFGVPGNPFKFDDTGKVFNEMDQLQSNVIYHFGGNNSGFDLACYPKAGYFNDFSDVAWNIETRFSTNDATTVEPITLINQKMIRTLEQYNGTQFPPKHTYLVMVLKRNVAKNFDVKTLPENCIVLTKNDLAACYGKSLVDYLLFLD